MKTKTEKNFKIAQKLEVEKEVHLRKWRRERCLEETMFRR